MGARLSIGVALLALGLLAACANVREPGAGGADPSRLDSLTPRSLSTDPATQPTGTSSPELPGSTGPKTRPSATVDPPERHTPSISGIDPALDGLVAQARADLARRLDVAPGQIRVVAAAAVTWPNGGLGCPEPGVMYVERLVEGALIVLAMAEVQYRYHVGGGRGPFLCER